MFSGYHELVQCLLFCSIPGLLSPVEKKNKVTTLFLVDFLAIFSAYILLTYSAVFAYNRNSIPSTYTTFFDGKSMFLFVFFFHHHSLIRCPDLQQTMWWQSCLPCTLYSHLQLTSLLSASPSEITLCALCRKEVASQLAFPLCFLLNQLFRTEDGAWLWVKRFKRPISTLVALVPSIAIAFATCDVSLLVSITGSFPGLGIMFFMPLALVFFARRSFLPT